MSDIKYKIISVISHQNVRKDINDFNTFVNSIVNNFKSIRNVYKSNSDADFFSNEHFLVFYKVGSDYRIGRWSKRYLDEITKDSCVFINTKVNYFIKDITIEMLGKDFTDINSNILDNYSSCYIKYYNNPNKCNLKADVLSNNIKSSIKDFASMVNYPIITDGRSTNKVSNRNIPAYVYATANKIASNSHYGLSEPTKQINIMRIDYKSGKVLDQETVDSTDVQYKVQETALSVQTKILDLKKKIKQATAELNEVKTTYPLDIDKYLFIKGNIANITVDLNSVKELKEELGFNSEILELD